MTQDEPNRFQAILTAKVAELDRLTHQRDWISIERRPDQREETQWASERALAFCNLDRGFNQLRNARAPLRRIEEGRFGACRQCDQDIHELLARAA
jgi:RNA polymerase-binding transcription factor DksA